MSEQHIPVTVPLNEAAFGCSCGRVHRFDWTGWSTSAPRERTLGAGSGYVRGSEFWTHVTVSHGREVR